MTATRWFRFEKPHGNRDLFAPRSWWRRYGDSDGDDDICMDRRDFFFLYIAWLNLCGVVSCEHFSCEHLTSQGICWERACGRDACECVHPLWCTHMYYGPSSTALGDRGGDVATCRWWFAFMVWSGATKKYDGWVCQLATTDGRDAPCDGHASDRKPKSMPITYAAVPNHERNLIV